MNTQGNNPYAPPAAIVNDSVETTPDGNFIPGGRSVPAGNATAWLSAAWAMFKQSPGAWIGLVLVFFVLYMVVSLIPLLNLFTIVLMPILTGGVMIACDNQRRTGSLQIGDLFAGFQNKGGALALVGLILFGIALVVFLGLALIVGFGMFGAIMAGENAGAMLAGLGFAGLALIMVLAFAVAVLTYAAVWYAPVLVVLHDVPPFEAMKMSFSGCLRNIPAGLVFFLVTFVLALLATIPLLLGWLVLGPVMWAAVYTSYRDIYLES